MKFTLAIPTNADWNRLNSMKMSLISNTAEPENVKVIFIDNCNTNNHNMDTWFREFQDRWAERNGQASLIKLPERVGLTTAWKACTDESKTEWTCITNDDLYFMPAWDTTFKELVERKQEHDIFLLCNPYNWSGFAVNKKFIQDFPWRTEFPEGYFEDDDIYLRVASANNLHKKSEIYTKAIYNLPYVESRYCFEHRPVHSKNDSKFHRGWDGPLNKQFFDQWWQEVTPKFPGAIENKNGKYFVKL